MKSDITTIELTNDAGMRAVLSSLGAGLLSLGVPDGRGHTTDVVLGYAAPEDYLSDEHYLGSVVGRFAGRIAGGEFALGGRRVRLTRNHGRHHLHGGERGFSRRNWVVRDKSSSDVAFTYTSADGEEGYPGKLYVEAAYSLTADNALHITYSAVADQPTVVNLTNHSYFNLSGHASGDILNHRLQLASDQVIVLDTDSIPTGELLDVSNSCWDFRRSRAFGESILSGDESLRDSGGYDHAWVLNGGKRQLAEPVARLFAPDTNLAMEVFTDQNSLLVYTGNFLPDRWSGKSGASYGRWQGFCLEAQHPPNSPNLAGFPTTVLRPGDSYSSTTVYRFVQTASGD